MKGVVQVNRREQASQGAAVLASRTVLVDDLARDPSAVIPGQLLFGLAS